MEKIQLQIPENFDEMMVANAIATFIVNRAAAFDKYKYNRIVVEIKDTDIGNLTFNLIGIVSNFTGVPIYVELNTRKTRFWVKNKIFRLRPRLWINYLIRKKDTLYLDAISNVDYELNTAFPKLYYGFDMKEIRQVSKLLYHWNDDKKEYLKWKEGLKNENNND